VEILDFYSLRTLLTEYAATETSHAGRTTTYGNSAGDVIVADHVSSGTLYAVTVYPFR
jgi:hypothetical protein